jgi:hypothetical protein
VAIVTIDGAGAYEAQLFSARAGAWHVDLRVPDEDAKQGRVTVVIGSRTLSGTAVRTGAFAGSTQVRVAAGAGGLGVSARPRHYDSPSVRIVLADLMADAGEALSATSDAAVLALALESWSTTARPVGAVIRDLLGAAAPAATWRALDDGTFWVGTDAFADAGLDASTYQVLDRSREENSVTVALDGPVPLVGATFEGGRVNCVQDDVPQSGVATTRVWFENAATATADRLLAAFQALVRGTPASFDARSRYWAAVVRQAGATVDAQPDDPGVPGMGNVPLAAQAGDSVDGVTGGRVLVGWAGGSGRRVAAGFDASASPRARTLAVREELNLGGTGGQPPPRGDALLAYLDALAAAVVTAGGPAQSTSEWQAATGQQLLATKAKVV